MDGTPVRSGTRRIGTGSDMHPWREQRMARVRVCCVAILRSAIDESAGGGRVWDRFDADAVVQFGVAD